MKDSLFIDFYYLSVVNLLRDLDILLRTAAIYQLRSRVHNGFVIELGVTVEATAVDWRVRSIDRQLANIQMTSMLPILLL